MYYSNHETQASWKIIIIQSVNFNPYFIFILKQQKHFIFAFNLKHWLKVAENKKSLYWNLFQMIHLLNLIHIDWEYNIWFNLKRKGVKIIYMASHMDSKIWTGQICYIQ